MGTTMLSQISEISVSIRIAGIIPKPTAAHRLWRIPLIEGRRLGSRYSFRAGHIHDERFYVF
jgi:hypothetical protein